jgi:4-hydroxy-3-polyprenylbenzoate decarboxylase
MRVVVGLTGASGAIIGVRLVQVLDQAGHEVDLILSRGGELTLAAEVGDRLEMPAVPRWGEADWLAPIASSSNAPDAMLVAPCSMKTLAAIARGHVDTLIVRVAEVMLRMNRPLVLMPRETPLSLPALENMVAARRAGAVILPPMVGYYARPKSVDDVTDFFVGKALDVLHIEHDLYPRWSGGGTRLRGAESAPGGGG